MGINLFVYQPSTCHSLNSYGKWFTVAFLLGLM